MQPHQAAVDPEDGGPGPLRRRLAELWGPAVGWHVGVLGWVAFVALGLTLFAYRAFTHSSLAKLIESKDVPFLAFMDGHFGYAAWLNVLLGAALCVLAFVWWRDDRGARSRQVALALGALATLATAWCLRYRHVASGVETAPTGVGEWLWLAALVGGAWALVRLRSEGPAPGLPGDAPAPGPRGWQGLAGVYLVALLAVAAVAAREHLILWSPAQNGGYRYARFFAPGELPQANLVLFSSSLLFGSLAAGLSCAVCLLFRAAGRREREDGWAPLRRRAGLAAAAIALTLTLPWMVKVSVEIRGEESLIFPAAVIGCVFAAALPLLFAAAAQLEEDLVEQRVTEAELGPPDRALIALTTFPLYPWLRLVRPFPPAPPVEAGGKEEGPPAETPAGLTAETDGQAASGEDRGPADDPALAATPCAETDHASAGPGGAAAEAAPVRRASARLAAVLLRAFRPGLLALWLGVSSLGLILASLNLAYRVEHLYEFEDWRGMLKSGLFPALRVVLSLVGAGAFYVLAARAARRLPAAPRRAGGVAVHVLAAVGLGFATWPLWGWGSVPRNVHTRLVEYSDRHEFERRFLCWLFDRDRDGYAGALGGGDPDDGDAAVQGAGLPALREVALPQDELVVAEPVRARRFPNLVVLTLEGVTPRAISAYGLRDLEKLGQPATPHLDRLAAEGARMTRAYCAYPSTWDGWFMLNAGRTLSIQEFDSSRPFGDRYSRYNNLHKLLRAVGIERFCYPNVNPYIQLFVPEEDREGIFELDFSASPTDDEDKAGVTKGDKRTDRLVRFIQTLKPGERFYLGEHFVDTHFPWKSVSTQRAAELGYPDGLSWTTRDAYVDGEYNSRLGRYYQQITRMDTQIGRIVAALRAQDVLDETLIVVASDHGCQWYEHEHCYYVSHLYDQCLRIPFIVRGPGVKPGGVIDLPTAQVDLIPTLMELGGLRLEDPARPLEGRSLLQVWGGAPPDAEQRQRLGARDLLLKTHYDTLAVMEAFRFKLVVDRPTGARWLFDLERDPGELENLIDTRPDLEARLSTRLRELVEERMVFLGGIQRSSR